MVNMIPQGTAAPVHKINQDSGSQPSYSTPPTKRRTGVSTVSTLTSMKTVPTESMLKKAVAAVLDALLSILKVENDEASEVNPAVVRQEVRTNPELSEPHAHHSSSCRLMFDSKKAASLFCSDLLKKDMPGIINVEIDGVRAFFIAPTLLKTAKMGELPEVKVEDPKLSWVNGVNLDKLICDAITSQVGLSVTMMALAQENIGHFCNSTEAQHKVLQAALEKAKDREAVAEALMWIGIIGSAVAVVCATSGFAALFLCGASGGVAAGMGAAAGAAGTVSGISEGAKGYFQFKSKEWNAVVLVSQHNIKENEDQIKAKMQIILESVRSDKELWDNLRQLQENVYKVFDHNRDGG